MGRKMNSRKSNRLKSFNYTINTYYFITICVKYGVLGRIKEDGSVQLNKYGKIVKQCWINLYGKYISTSFDEFIVMPDHFHAMVELNYHKHRKVLSLSTLIGMFKSVTSKKIHSIGFETFCWQRSFYDRIIRNEKELFNARKYIKYNPLKVINR